MAKHYRHDIFRWEGEGGAHGHVPAEWRPGFARSGRPKAMFWLEAVVIAGAGALAAFLWFRGRRPAEADFANSPAYTAADEDSALGANVSR